MLHILCRIGQDRYAISCMAVEKIVPFAHLKDLPGAIRGLRGLLNYERRSVPVVDLSLLLAGSPAREVLDTRILLCPLADAPSGLLGLLVEGVSEAQQLPDSAFQPAGAAGDDCLRQVTPSGKNLIQRIEVPAILPDDVLRRLHLAENAAAR